MENKIGKTSNKNYFFQQAFAKSDAMQNILNKRLNFFLRNGMFILFFIGIIVFTLTCFVTIPTELTGEVIIENAHGTNVILSKSNGRISQIFVADKQQVKKGDLLFIMETIALKSEMDSLENGILSQEECIKNERFYALFNNSTFDYNSTGEIQTQLQQYISAFNNLKNAIIGQNQMAQFSIIDQKINTALLAANNLIEQKRLFVKEVEIAIENYNTNMKLYNDKAISMAELRVFENNKIGKELQLKQIESQIISNKNVVNDLQDNLLVLNKNIESQKIAFLEARKILLSAINKWKFENVITAPESGIVFFGTQLYKNMNVLQNQQLCLIGNPNNEIIANIKLSQNNIGKVKIGQKVKITLNGYNFMDYGFITGSVNFISQMAIDDGYMVTVSLPNRLKTNYNKEILFKNGLKGSAAIIAEEKTLFQQLLKNNK